MIICAALKDNRTGAVFGSVRHQNIYTEVARLESQADSIRLFLKATDKLKEKD